MDPVDPKIERLIVRQLDGEISEAEQLELNRELLRNPDAHQLWEEYRSLDSTASEVLESVLSVRSAPFDPTTLPARVPAKRTHYLRRNWLLLTGAVAAAILALAIPKPTVVSQNDPTELVEKVDQSAPVINVARRSRPVNTDGLMRNASMPSVQRETGTEVFGVMDENGNIYWIEVERSRTLRRPVKDKDGRASREIL